MLLVTKKPPRNNFKRTTNSNSDFGFRKIKASFFKREINITSGKRSQRIVSSDATKCVCFVAGRVGSEASIHTFAIPNVAYHFSTIWFKPTSGDGNIQRINGNFNVIIINI